MLFIKTYLAYWINQGYSKQEADIIAHQYRVMLGVK